MPGKTLGDVLAEYELLTVRCQHPACFKTRKLDVATLAERLGTNHGAIHHDLVKLFRCAKCEAERRPRLPVRSPAFLTTPASSGRGTLTSRCGIDQWLGMEHHAGMSDRCFKRMDL